MPKAKFPFKVINDTSYSKELEQASAEVVEDIAQMVQEFNSKYIIPNKKWEEKYSAEFDKYQSIIESNYMDVAIQIHNDKYAKNKRTDLDDKTLMEFLMPYKYLSGVIQKDDVDENGEMYKRHEFVIRSRKLQKGNFDINAVIAWSKDKSERYMVLHIILYADTPKKRG